MLCVGWCAFGRQCMQPSHSEHSKHHIKDHQGVDGQGGKGTQGGWAHKHPVRNPGEGVGAGTPVVDCSHFANMLLNECQSTPASGKGAVGGLTLAAR